MGERSEAAAVVRVLRERVRGAVAARVGAPRGLDVGTLVAAVALAGALPVALTRVAANVPVAVPVVATPAWRAMVEAAALVGPALALLALGVRAAAPAGQVGLVAVGAFGLLAAVVPAARVPATGATIAGGWLVVGPRLVATRGAEGVRWSVVAVAVTILAGLGLSLGGALGFAPGALRPAGSSLAAVGVAAVPAAIGAGRREWAVFGGVVALALAAGASAPFVTGAVVLVVGGAVGSPFPLVALAVGGAAAAVAAGLHRGRPALAGTGGLLLAAGVPATLPRALAATVAVAILVDGFAAAEPGGDPA